MNNIESKIEQGLELFEQHGFDIDKSIVDIERRIDRGISDGEKRKSNDSNKTLGYWFAFIIGMCLVAYAAYFLYSHYNDNTEVENYYASNFEMLPSPIEDGIIRGEQENYQKDIYDQAAVHYNNKNYKEALIAWNDWSGKNPTSDEINLYRSILFLFENEPDQAIEILKSIKDIEYIEEARWYLSLAYLKLNKLESCLELLEYILASEHHYKKSAAENLYRSIAD